MSDIPRSDFLSRTELSRLGLGQVGAEVSVSRNAQFIAPERVSIGKGTRIDAFTVISAGAGGVSIGRNVHLSAFCSIVGRGTVQIGDFCTVSVRCSIFSSSDDFSGRTMANPTVPDEYRGAEDGVVEIKAHAILGAGCVVLPGVAIGLSAAIGAMTLVRDDIPDLAIAVGIPARVIGTRDGRHLEFARDYLEREVGPT